MPAERATIAETKIEVRDLCVRRSGSQVLRGINFSAPALRTVAFIGAAHSGKTTLLRAINRLHDLDPDVQISGSIKLDGAEVLTGDSDVADLRRRAGMVFSSPATLPLPVFDNVTFGLRAMGVQDPHLLAQRCERALRRAGAWERVSRSFSAAALSLPLDVQQQLCIARALAVDPDLLLFDDPTAQLDPLGALKIEEVISRLRRDYTVLLATNDLQLAARISDTTCYLARGEVVEIGDTTAVFSRPGDSRTEEFLAGHA